MRIDDTNISLKKMYGFHFPYSRQRPVSTGPDRPKQRTLTATSSMSNIGKHLFGNSKDKRSGRDTDEAILDYDLMYPSTPRESSIDNPRDSGSRRNEQMSYASEEFEYKDGIESEYDEYSRRRLSTDSRNSRRQNTYKPYSFMDVSIASCRGYPGSQDCTSVIEGFPNVLTAYKNGTDGDFIQCVIVRDRSGFQAKMSPSYELRLQESNKTLILAKKMNMNRTSNYHLFDMTRAQVGTVLSKKSGNYLGKLRARNTQRTEYLLLNDAPDRQEVAGFVFDRADSMMDIREGIRPRKLTVIIPPLSSEGLSVPHYVKGNEQDVSVIDMLRAPSSPEKHGMHIFETKEPVFVNGNFRLNFHGRVSVPSIKNFQIVSDFDIDHIVLQFGKVNDDRFHLDFKTPFNAFQAFALALSQFNL